MAAMNAFKDALIKKDVGAMDKLVHEELQYSHSNGVLTQDKKVWLEYVAKEANTVYLDWGEQRIRVYGNTAVATGVVDIRGGDGKTPFLVKTPWTQGGGGGGFFWRQAPRVTPALSTTTGGPAGPTKKKKSSPRKPRGLGEMALGGPLPAQAAESPAPGNPQGGRPKVRGPTLA